MTDGEVVLRDGRTVRVRPLRPDDRGALAAALARADRDDLRRRFMGTPPPTWMVLDLLSRADGVHDAAIGAFDHEGRLVGVAQFDRLDDGPAADVALEVAKDWQGCGLGHELAWRIARFAFSRGVRTFTISYLAENSDVASLLKDSGHAELVRIADGGAEATVDLSGLAGPTP